MRRREREEGESTVYSSRFVVVALSGLFHTVEFREIEMN